MRELEVPFLRRWIMWAAVRWAAPLKERGRKGWLREGWRVVVFSLVALPFIAVPGVLIVFALLAFNLLELVIWVALRLGGTVRTEVLKQAPEKKVNLLRLEWKTSQ